MTTFGATSTCNNDGTTHVQIRAITGTDEAVIVTNLTFNGGTTHTVGAIVPGQLVYTFDTGSAGTVAVHSDRDLLLHASRRTKRAD